MAYVILKKGHRGNGDPFVEVDSRFHDNMESADIVLRRRRQDRDMAKTEHRYAIAEIALPAEEEFA